jgi:hypothetical protein
MSAFEVTCAELIKSYPEDDTVGVEKCLSFEELNVGNCC